jgi:hypothetical protein
VRQNSKNTQHSRRGFFRSFLSDFVAETNVETAEQHALKQRASVLALKYGKNEARLAKIGVKSPVPIDETGFQVELTGHDATGETHCLKLKVNPETGDVRPFEVDSAAKQGNPES